MAITAKFTADFSDFNGAVTAASGTLKKLESDAATASRSVAKLTDDAAGKFTVTTKQMQAAGIATQNWSKDFQRFDSVLSSVGINIGTTGKALGELGAAAGQTATSMGLLGTAGLAAGAAIAGWQIGRWIADLFDLDTKIANLNGSIDRLKAQEKGAGLDVLANASRIAGRAITDMAEALRIVNQAQADHLLVTGRSANAAGDAGKAYAQMYGEIRAVRERGDLEALNRDLQSYDFSLQTLSKRYGVHTEALEFYRKTLKAAEEQEKTRAKVLEDNKRALDKLIEADWAGVLKGETVALIGQNTELQKNLDLFNQRTLAEFEAQRTLAALKYGPAGGAAPLPGSPEAVQAAYGQIAGQGSAADQEIAYLQFIDNFDKATRAAGQMGEAVKGAGDKTQQTAAQVQQASGHLAQLGQAANWVAGSFQNMWTQVGHGATQESALRNFNDMAAAYGKAGIFVQENLMGGNMARRAAGGPVTAGVPYRVGEHGPELFVPNTSGAIVPGGGGGVQVNVSGLILSDDPAARQQLAAIIQDALMASYRQHGNRQPV